MQFCEIPFCSLTYLKVHLQTNKFKSNEDARIRVLFQINRVTCYKIVISNAMANAKIEKSFVTIISVSI